MRLTRRGRAVRDYAVLLAVGTVFWTVLIACYLIGETP